MTSANIQRKNTFLNWGISIAIGLVLSAGLNAASYNVSTIAGSAVSFSGDGAIATAARLRSPFGIFVHSSGDVYFADTDNNRIRKITASTGFISTIAGTGTSSFSGDDGPATAATLSVPRGVYLDSSDNIYIADSFNNRIRKITATTGVISTLQSGLNRPRGIFLDNSNNIYFADSNNHRVCKIVSGTMSVIAGITGTASFTGDGAAATAATLNTPSGIYVDSSNNVYIADTGNNHIRMIAGSTASIFGSARTVGNIYTIAGGSVTTAGFAGDGASATAAAVRFNSPYSVCLDSTGNVYIADGSNNRIRMLINTAGTYFGSSRTANFIYTIAGTGTAGFLDGLATTTARLSVPQGISIDSTGNIYFTESTYSRIRKLNASSNIISTIAGGLGDGGLASAASLNAPRGVCRDITGNTYIADYGNNRIRMINVATNIISTIAGNGVAGFGGDGGPATASMLNGPTGFFVDSSKNIYIADQNNHRLRIVWGAASNGSYIQGNIYTIAGTGTPTYNGDNIPATSASLFGVSGVYVSNAGDIYVADQNNRRIRKFRLGGNISTVAGTATPGFTGDGGPATAARLQGPQNVFLDALNNIYIADFQGARIRKVTASTGIISTIAGTGIASFSGDGGAATSSNISPFSVYVDGSSSVYVADWTNHRVRKINGGTISTIAGTGVGGYTGDGGPATAALLNTVGNICVDNAGKVYVADTSNNVIRKLTLPSVTYSGSQTLPGSATGTANITGGGTVVLPASNTFNEIEIGSGTLQVSSSAPITFNASGGSAIVEILAAINTGAFTFNTPGAVKIATGIAAILDAPSGSSLMSKTGAGRLRAIANLSTSTTPVAISEGILEVSGASGKLPNAATTVANGATLQLGTAGDVVANGAVPGAASIASGGIVAVAAGVNAPSDTFSSVTFNSGGIVQLGDGANLAQSFTAVV